MLLGPYQRNLKKYNIFNRFSIVLHNTFTYGTPKGGTGGGAKIPDLHIRLIMYNSGFKANSSNIKSRRSLHIVQSNQKKKSNNTFEIDQLI